MKPLRILVAMILFAGASLTARAMYLDAKANLASVLIHRAWAKTAETGAPQAPWPWADSRPVARLRIPRIGYDEIVLEGATNRTLAFGPARLLSGANLGEPGNVELAGHGTVGFGRWKRLTLGTRLKFSGSTREVTNSASAPTP
jgi:sortase A